MKKLISGPGFNHLVVARHGYVLYNVNDRYVGRSIEHYGEWSPGETALFRQFCRPGHYVVDVGAHIGTHTLASPAASPAQARHLRGERQAREVARVIGLVRSHGYRLFWAASWRRRPPSGNGA